MDNWKVRQAADLYNGRIETFTGDGISTVRGDSRNIDWIVSALYNRKPADLSGLTCSGYAVRPDGATVPLVGLISENVCTLKLDQLSHAIEGNVQAYMVLTDGNGETIMTLSKISFYVDRGSTNVVVDTGEHIPTLNELLAEIEHMRDGTQAANEAAEAANAAADRLSEVELDVEMLPPGSDPTGNVTQTDTKTTFELGIPASELIYAFFAVDDEMYLNMYMPEGFYDFEFALTEQGDLEVQMQWP